MTQFGEYTIHRRLGGGGMGDVYLATDRRMNRKVALKILKRKVAVKKEHVQRFMREVQSVARLEHPNIIKVYEVGEESGNHYFAMEYVPGLPLNHALKRGDFDFQNIASIFRDVASALDHAHGRGVIHRDIKLSNILIGQNGVVKLVDFGLAREFGSSELTATGQILGTPAYMAPEQIRGEKARIGPRSDVYSLGAILYVALTGQAPFEGENSVQVLKAVLGARLVSPRRLNPRIPRTLERICLKAMAREPEDRYSSAGIMARDLARFAEGRLHFVLPNLRMRIRFNLGLAAQVACYAALVVALGVVLSVGWSQSGHSAEIGTIRAENERLLAAKKRLAEADPEADLAAARRWAEEGFAHLRAGRTRRALLALSRSDALGAVPGVARQIEFVQGLLSGGAYRPDLGLGEVSAVSALEGGILGAQSPGSLWLGDLSTGATIGTATPEGIQPGRLAFLPGGRWCGIDGNGVVRWGSLQDPGVRTPFPSAKSRARSIAVDHGGTQVAIGFEDGQLAVLDAAAEIRATWSLAWPALQLAYGAAGLLYFVVDGSAVWSVDSSTPGSIPRVLGGPASGPIRLLETSPTGTSIAIVTGKGQLESFDPRDPFLSSPSNPGGSSIADELEVSAMSFHPSGAILGTAEEGGVVRLWLVGEGTEFVRIETGQTEVKDLEFVLGGAVLVAAGSEGLTFHDLSRLEGPR